MHPQRNEETEAERAKAGYEAMRPMTAEQMAEWERNGSIIPPPYNGNRGFFAGVLGEGF